MVLAEFKCEQPRKQLAEQATRIADQATRIAELKVLSAPRLEITCHFQVSLAMAVEQGHTWRDSEVTLVYGAKTARSHNTCVYECV